MNTIFHLLFHPTLWRYRLRQQCSAVAPTFSLFNLKKEALHSPHLKHLLFFNYVVAPLLSAGSVAVVLGVAGWEWSYVQLGVVCALVWHSSSLLLLGLSISVAFGIVVASLGSLAIGLSLGGLSMGLLPVIAGNLGVTGMACSILSHLDNEKRRHSLTKETGSIIIGTLVSLGILWLGYALANVLLPSLTEFADLDHQDVRLLGIIALLGLSIGWLSGGWRWGLIFSVVFAGVIGGFFWRDSFAATDLPKGLNYALNDALQSASLSLLLNGVFALPYLLAQRFADIRAGIAAGCLVLSFAYLFVAWGMQADTWLLWLGPAALLLGLAQNQWRPFLFYPFAEAWNLLLYQAEQRCRDRAVLQSDKLYLRFHTAFWDEQQHLPLYSLEKHLVWLYEQAPDIARHRLEQLGGTTQAWAVSAVYQEIDLRRMEKIQSIEEISQIYRHLHNPHSGSPSSALLQQFRSISQDVEAALAQSSHYAQRMMLNELETRFNQLLLELNRYHNSLVQRFHPLIMLWRKHIIDAAQSMENLANDLQEIHNPYVVGIPLTAKQNIFVGRRDVIARIEKLLLDQSCPPILLYGQRRTGKTSVLNNLSRLLSSRFLFAYVDFQSPRLLTGEITGLLYGLAHSLNRAAELYPEYNWPKLERAELAEHPFEQFDAWLDHVEQALDGRTLLIAMDEFVTLEEARQRGHVSDATVFTLLSMLRHIIQHRQRFRLLLAGSHSLDELNQWASYLINVQIVHLHYLTRNEALRLIEQPIEGFALRYSAAAAQRVLHVTRAHPALVQLLCSEIVELKNMQPIDNRRQAELEDVAEAIPQALMTGAFFFNDIAHNQIDPQALAVLRFIAQQGEGACVSHAELQSLFAEHLDNSLKQLLRRELLESCPKQSAYRMQVELVRQSVLLL